MSNLKFWFPGILGDVKMLKKLKKSNSVEGKIRKLRFSLSVTLNLGFSWVKSIFQPICLMSRKKCLIGNFRKVATILVPWWLIFKTCQFGTSFLLHGFWKFLLLKSFFLGHLEYSSHILAEKILLIQENPKFSVIGRVNLSFLIFPSTEFNFSNFFSIPTSRRIPKNQN